MVDTTPRPVAQEEPYQANHSNTKVALAAAGIAGVCLTALGITAMVEFSDNNSSSPSNGSSTVASSTQVSASASDCPVISGQSWPLNYDPNRTGDVVQGGVHSPQDVDNAAKADPKVLVGYGQLFLPATFPAGTDYHKYVDQSGKCLNTDGVVAFKQLEAYEAQSNPTVGEAPAGFVNTGMGMGGIVSNAAPGITGDLKAVIYTTPDGRKVVILERCGNPAEQTPSYPQTPPSTVITPPSTPPVTTTETCSSCCGDTCVTTTTDTTTPPSTTTPPPCPPGTVPPECLATKEPTTNEEKPTGVVPLPLPSEDTLQPTQPSNTNRQTTPRPTDAPVQTTTRTSAPPTVPTELPSPTTTHTVMPSDPGQ